jgi:hypothetical protein
MYKVIPAQAGIHCVEAFMDPCLRRDDKIIKGE